MQIIGHRGARLEAPENTLGGFIHLCDLGIRAVEFDVRQLGDGQLVVIHDDNVLRTSGEDSAIATAHYADFAHSNQAAVFAAQQHWQFEKLPLLHAVLAILGDFNHIEIELKAVPDAQAAQRLIDELLRVLALYPSLTAQITLTSFDLKILRCLQLAAPHYKRGFLVEMPFGEHAIHMAVQLGCTRIGWKDMLVTEELVKQSHAAHLQVSVWTVNVAARAKQLYGWKIDGLITDVPTLMQQTFLDDGTIA